MHGREIRQGNATEATIIRFTYGPNMHVLYYFVSPIARIRFQPCPSNHTLKILYVSILTNFTHMRRSVRRY
jgi:hypothetical protein